MKNTYTLATLLLLFFFTKAQTWSAVDRGIEGQVNAIAIYNGQLYAAGDFDSAGSLAANDIAMWNGNSWDTVGGGVLYSHFTYPHIDAMAVYNNELYAAGGFDSIEGGAASNIASWNGSTWAALNPGLPAGYTMIVYNNELYVAGTFFTIAGGLTVNGIARWNGSTWADLDGGVHGGNGIAALGVYNNMLIAAGNFATAGSNNLVANNIAAWNGTAWSAIGTGIGDTSNAAVYAVSVYNGNLYIGGDFSQAGSVFAQNVAEWDGTNWAALGAGLGNHSDTDYVVCLLPYNGNLIAGGYFSVDGNGNPVNSIASWNGASWSAMGLGVSAGAYGVGYVYALCQWNGDLYVGGDFIKAGNATAYSIAKWSSPSAVDEIPVGGPILVYPNPTNGDFISIENITPGSPVIITNLLGQTMAKTVTTGNKQILDISLLSAGIYFVNGVKFIKQ